MVSLSAFFYSYLIDNSKEDSEKNAERHIADDQHLQELDLGLGHEEAGNLPEHGKQTEKQQELFDHVYPPLATISGIPGQK